MMEFNSRDNVCHTTLEGKKVWESRSVAVVGMILMLHEGEKYVILGKRGPASPNEVGKWCMPCGYLDWNETISEAAVRETREESGLNVYKAMNNYEVLHDQMDFPWKINSHPDAGFQNVSMHFALYLNSRTSDGESTLPELTTKYNPVAGEVEEVKWVKVSEIDDYDCAFNHESTIRVFVNSLI